MSSHAPEDPPAEDGSASAGTVSNPGVAERPTADGPSSPASAVEAKRADRHHRAREKQGVLAFLRELPVLLLVAFVLALLIKTFLVQAFYIPSASMEPTLQIGDRVLVNKIPYRFHPPRRGDIIVFSDPHPPATARRNPVSAFVRWLTEGLGVSSNPQKDFIKRVIGVPGDTVEIDGRGTVFVNGKALSEPYISPFRDNRPYGPIRVRPRSLFVLGDNRTLSNDSRFGLGFIPYDKVVGRAFVVIWPPSRIRWLHGG